MRFQLFIALVFFLTPYFSQGRDLTSDSDKQKGKKQGMENFLIDIHNQVRDMVQSGLFERDSNLLSNGIRLPSPVKASMKERCPNSLDALNSAASSYNSLTDNLRLGNGGIDNSEDFTNINHAINGIKSGVSACVKELKTDYVDLSVAFATPLNQSYLGHPARSAGVMNYLDQRLVNFVRNHIGSVEEKSSKIKTQVLSYNDFKERCISSEQGINEIYLTFHGVSLVYGSTGWIGIKRSYAKLKNFFSDEYCWGKLNELKAFTSTDLFKEFVGLPQRCKNNNSEIESLKKAVLVVDSEGGDTSPPDALNYCKEELEKTASVCFCGSENCDEEGEDSFLSKLNDEDSKKELCEKNYLNKALDVCLKRANLCSSNCNNRLSEFKKKYKDLFFVSDLSLGANNIHAHFKTACLDDMKEIVESYKGSVSRKPPYSGVEKVRNSALSSFNNLGLVCREPLESLESSYKSLEEKCERRRKRRRKKRRKKRLKEKRG